MRTRQVATDLSNHLRDRVITQVDDVMDTAERIRLPFPFFIAATIRLLLEVTVGIVISSGIGRRQFMAMCDDAFTEAKDNGPKRTARKGFPPGR
jgi:hypothetical protein